MRKLSAGIVAMLLLAACTDGGFDPFGWFGSEDDSWESRLADLPAPDWDSRIVVSVWDHERGTALAGVEPDDRRGLIDVSSTGAVAVVIPDVIDRNTWMLDGFRESNGYSRSDVAWAVEWSSPPYLAATLGGDFDLASLEAVNGPAENGTIESDDPLAMSLEDRGPGRMLGRQPRYDLDGDRLHVSHLTDDPTEGPRAIERSTVADLARVLDDLDAYAAQVFLGAEGIGTYLSLDGPMPDDLRETSTLPLPYVGVGLAFFETEDGDVGAAMLFFHRAEQVAEVNAEAVEAVLADGQALGEGIPWSEVVTDVEVTYDERVVIADVRLVDGATPYSLLAELNTRALIPPA